MELGEVGMATISPVLSLSHMCILLKNPIKELLPVYPHFTQGKTEVQTGEMTCPYSPARMHTPSSENIIWVPNYQKVCLGFHIFQITLFLSADREPPRVGVMPT